MIDTAWLVLLWALGMILMSTYIEDTEVGLKWLGKAVLIIYWPIAAIILGIISLMSYIPFKEK